MACGVRKLAAGGFSEGFLHTEFHTVGQFFEDFLQVSDEEVLSNLAQAQINAFAR